MFSSFFESKISLSCVSLNLRDTVDNHTHVYSANEAYESGSVNFRPR